MCEGPARAMVTKMTHVPALMVTASYGIYLSLESVPRHVQVVEQGRSSALDLGGGGS
jgi:hypothetical protein